MSFGLTMAGVAAALGPMVVPALTGAAVGAGTGLLTGGTSSDDWWQNMLMGGLGGAAFGGMGGMDKLSGMFGGSTATTGVLPAAASKTVGLGSINPAAGAGAVKDYSIFTGGLPAESIWGLPGKDAAGIAAMTGKQGAIPAGFNPASVTRPSGYDAAGLAAISGQQGPVQTAGLFSGGFKPGAYTMGAGDTVSKFTPPPGLLSNENLMKGLIGSSVLKNLKPQQQSKLPSQLSRSTPGQFPYRQPIMGGFMGQRPQRRRFSR